jgi:hypothetical protein
MAISKPFTKNMLNFQKIAKVNHTKRVFSSRMKDVDLDLEEEGSLWKTSQNLWVTESKIKIA